jgi:hypothetical protein
MIKDETVEKLESVGLRVDCTLRGISIYSAGGQLCGEVFIDQPWHSWLGADVFRNIWNGDESELTPLFELMSYGSGHGAMPELFVLDTTKGFVKLGESLGFTQSSPTMFTKKQLNKTRLRVAALNPITHKVN